jgi:hypothetical protein
VISATNQAVISASNSLWKSMRLFQSSMSTTGYHNTVTDLTDSTAVLFSQYAGMIKHKGEEIMSHKGLDKDICLASCVLSSSRLVMLFTISIYQYHKKIIEIYTIRSAPLASQKKLQN